MMAEERKIARILEDVRGYFVCPAALQYYDTRGFVYTSKAAALAAAYNSGYTHAIGSGTYWGNTIRKIPFNAQRMDQGLHERGLWQRRGMTSCRQIFS